MTDNKTYMGYAQTDITPAEAAWTIGFNREDNWSKGVQKSLMAQVTIWKAGEEICCLTAIDHIGFLTERADLLRNRIGKILNVSKEKVMLCFSHTHAAPNDDVERDYYELVCNKIEEAVASAGSDMKPVQIGWGNGYADIGLNRRKESIYLDRRVGILKVVGDDNCPRLILLRLTAHGNVLKADNFLISPDYFGEVRELLEDRYHCPVVLTQGASGNVAPRYFCSDLTPPDACDERFVRSDDALMKMAQETDRAVAEVFDQIHARPSERVSMRSRQMRFNSDVPDDEEACRVASEAFREAGICGDDWLHEIRRLRREGIAVQSEQTEIQFFHLGEGWLCGVPNEIMCEFALEVEKATGKPFCYLGGYTNGCTGYFPTAEEFDHGGYEVYWCMLAYFKYYGRVFPLRRESAAELIKAVIKTVSRQL